MPVPVPVSVPSKLFTSILDPPLYKVLRSSSMVTVKQGTGDSVNEREKELSARKQVKRDGMD